jgi:hypothetical protein
MARLVRSVDPRTRKTFVAIRHGCFEVLLA